MNKKEITQEIRVLDYLIENGSITSWEAIKEFGITRLSAKIYNLRKDGWLINKEFKSSKNRYGDIVSYAVYFLEKASEDEIF